MSIEKVREYFKGFGIDDRILEFDVSSATVALAAKALGCGMFVEFGPGKVLSGLVKKIDAALATSNVADLASLDATVAALA